MPAWLIIITLLAALGSGIMAGIFFVFSTSVMQALGRLPPAVGAAAMQSINEAILNPIFFLVFFGTAVGSLALGILALIGWSDAGSAWRLAGALLYLVIAIGITMRVHVPLNNRLAQADANGAEGTVLWAGYLKIWTRWNHIRTLGCIGATGSFILGMP